MAEAPVPGAEANPEERVRFIGIRRRTAEKMVQSARTIPHVSHFDEADLTELEALRAELKGEAEAKGVKLSPLAFVCKALTASAHAGSETMYQARGCKACHQTGFHGRRAIYEFFVMSPHIRELILQKATSDAIRKTAIELGMRTMREDAPMVFLYALDDLYGVRKRVVWEARSDERILLHDASVRE